MPKTTEYDVNFYYEYGVTDTPRLWASEMSKNEQGEWETVSDGVIGTYYFTPEDVAWLWANYVYDGTPYKEMSDLWIDEWYTSEDTALIDQLPPNAVAWVASLPEYEYEDLTKTEVN